MTDRSVSAGPRLATASGSRHLKAAMRFVKEVSPSYQWQSIAWMLAQLVIATMMLMLFKETRFYPL